jgi:PAS domain S-box-containing protein
VVWAEVGAQPEPAEDFVDLDAFLEAWPDEPEDPTRELTVEIRGAPIVLHLEALQHLDELIRELTLVSVGDETGVESRLPPGLAERVLEAAHAYEYVRRQGRVQSLAAQSRGETHVDLRLRVGRNVDRLAATYLGAFREADEYARDARLLSLESPVRFQVLRRWLTQTMHAESRRIMAGDPPVPLPTFEDSLIASLEAAHAEVRSTELAAKLQRLTARLASAEDADAVATIAYHESGGTLCATGGTVHLTDADQGVRTWEWDADVGLTEASLHLPEEFHGPVRAVSLTGQAVYLESKEERDGHFPDLAKIQPGAQAIAAVPVQVAGEMVGLLRLSFSAPHVFDSGERSYLEALAGQVAQAYARVRALAELRRGTTPSAEELAELLRPLPDSAGVRLAAIDLAVLRTLYGDAPIGVAVLDTEGRYLRLNHVVARTHRGTLSEQLGRTLEETLGPAQARSYRRRMERVIRSGRAIHQEDLRMVDAYGVERQWRSSMFPIRGPRGRVDAVVVIAADMTEQTSAS